MILILCHASNQKILLNLAIKCIFYFIFMCRVFLFLFCFVLHAAIYKLH